MKWGTARKKLIVIRYREVEPKELSGFECDVPCEAIYTREGMILGYPDEDFIIEGVEGELYPIKKDIFYKTYDIIVSTNHEGVNKTNNEEIRAKLEEIKKTIEEGLHWLEVERVKIQERLHTKR